MTPPPSLIELIDGLLTDLLEGNPAATSSEKYVQHELEFRIAGAIASPRYYLRIGINYHGAQVQHIQVQDNGVLLGWNPGGDALSTGVNAKMLLAGTTIFPRGADEQAMSDTKIGGGDIPPGAFVRVEWKVRGWLGKTKNLDGKQLEKDLDLLKNDRADLLVICLSETAHRKWRGEGPPHQVSRRQGCGRFAQILVPLTDLATHPVVQRQIVFEGQQWVVRSHLVRGLPQSIMPGAEHIVTMCWRE